MLKHLRSSRIHHGNSYLKLGPFKVEFLHKTPEIGIIHDFASSKEVDDIIYEAKGKTKSTPYFENGIGKGFSKQRTSKVMYMNELLVPEAEKISKKIEHATKTLLKSDQYASENFQVMNYGIGGKITCHTDTLGFKFTETCKAILTFVIS